MAAAIEAEVVAWGGHFVSADYTADADWHHLSVAAEFDWHTVTVNQGWRKGFWAASNALSPSTTMAAYIRNTARLVASGKDAAWFAPVGGTGSESYVSATLDGAPVVETRQAS